MPALLYLNQSAPNLWDNGILYFLSSKSYYSQQRQVAAEGRPQGAAGTGSCAGENDKA